MEASAIFRDCQARILDLPRARLAAKLQCQFMNLSEARSPNGMALAFQAPRGIDRYLAAQCGVSMFGKPSALTDLAKLQVFRLQDFREGGGVMHFRDRNIARRHARKRIGFGRGKTADMPFRFARTAIASAGKHGGAHAYRMRRWKKLQCGFAA